MYERHWNPYKFRPSSNRPSLYRPNIPKSRYRQRPLYIKIESKNGIHTIEAAEELGIGSRQYRLIELNL